MPVSHNAPMFSIVSVIRNVASREAMFRRSMESVLHQTVSDVEYIIQDGGSTDGTADIVAEYRDSRIHFISASDSGPEEGFFRALKRCRGTYIGSCLSDEELLPDALENARRAFEDHPQIAAFYGDVSYVNENGEKWGPRVPPHPFYIEAYVCQIQVPPFCSSFFRREAVETAGLHKHPWRCDIGEFEFWVRIADVGEIIYQPFNISCFGRHTKSNTRTSEIYDRLLAARARVMPALFRENKVLRECNVSVEQAIGGNYAWGAAAVFSIEGLSEKCRHFMRQAERYDPKSPQLGRLRSRIRGDVVTVEEPARVPVRAVSPAPRVTATPSVPQASNRPAPRERADRACEPFGRWIEALASMDNRLYYRDQSVETLTALCSRARDFDPTVIVELGTLGGLSLRTWLAGAERARVVAIDLSFTKLAQTRQVLPLDLSRVTLLEQDILKTDFASLWTARDRVILFVDAHDLPNVPIMDHVLTKALPALPDGSMVIVDDLWFSEERLTHDNARSFLESRVLGEIDGLQCFEGHYAPYHGGGSFMGFAEVIPLLKFVNAHGIPLAHEKSEKHVSFAWHNAYLSHRHGADSVERTECFGSVLYNPLTSVPVSAPLRDTMHRIAQDYQQKRIAQAAESLAGLMEQHPRDPGLAYGLAVCLARCRELTRARDVLGRVVQNSTDPRCRRLLDDLVTRVGPCNAAPSRVPPPRSEDRGGMTLFAMPKPFVGHIGTIQKNAIRSWARLNPAPQIILFGDELGTREMAQEVGACHIPEIDRNEFGTPLVNNLFEAAQKHASHRIVAYVNADIILFQNFVQGVHKVQTGLPEFLLVGQRWDLMVLDEMDFDRPDWQGALEREMGKRAMLHGECGLDYFVFSKGVYAEIPPFAIGRIAWDNWLVMAPHRSGVPVVDGTEFITAVHQDHDYGHVAGGRRGAWGGAEAARNRALAGTVDDSAYASGATWVLRRDGRLAQMAPREPLFSTTAYREYRYAWLATEARRLMALGQVVLAAAKWEETIPVLERLLVAARQKGHSGASDHTRLAECYATSCVSLAQCYMEQGCYDRVVTSYTRLLETSLFEIPQAQRDDIQRVCDQVRRRLSQDGRSPGERRERSSLSPTVHHAGEKRTALIVSIPERVDDLCRTIRDIEDQVDDIRVLLNGHETVPDDLRDFTKVSRVETSPGGELYASGAWKLLAPDDEGYVLVLDDDIVYPADYAERMIAKIEEHQRRAVVVVHGMDFRPPYGDFILDRTLYHFETACPQDRIVHAGGVGTLVFHTSTIRPQMGDFPDPNFRDLWFAVLATRHKLPIVCIARDAGWLLPRRTQGKQLWRMAYQQDWRNQKNEVFRTNLLPLLDVDVRATRATEQGFSIFSFTNGRSTFDYSIRSLTDSWDRHEKIVVLRDMHFFEAATQCLENCETPYFFKVDDDFILHPKAIAYMRRQVLAYPHPEELGIYYCHLWEDWTSRVRQSIKVYRVEALRRIGGFQANHQGKVDETTKAALRQAGFKVVQDPSVVALHACGTWEEQLEYERLWSAMAEAPYKKPTHDAMKAYCGTKSLDTQYAMRLRTLEYINQQLQTPFHQFLIESSTASQNTAWSKDASQERDASRHGANPAAVGGSQFNASSRPRRERVRDCGSRPEPTARCGSEVGNGRKPRVTVITTCRNGEEYLPECLDSILKQTMSEWELLLLDDGSTDGTRGIIETYAARDARIRAFYFDESTGPYIRRNFAIRQARAPFIVIQDGDDIMCPDKVQRLYDVIAGDERLGVVGSFYRVFLDEFSGLERTEAMMLPTTHEEILGAYKTEFIWDFSWHGSAIIRRTLFDEIGLYDENPFGADSFWLAKVAEYARCTGRIQLHNIPEFLTLRRVHGNSQTGRLPTIDPRSRRARYVQYCHGKLQEVASRTARDPNVDAARALRECTCGDFLQRFGAQIIQWESQPVDDRAVAYSLQRALQCLRERQHVTCMRVLRGLEIMDPAIAQRVVNFDLAKAIAFHALGQREQCQICLRREMVNHDNAVARQFHEEAFKGGVQIAVRQWCAGQADAPTLQITDPSRPEPSPAAQVGTPTAAGGSPKVTVITTCRNAARFLPECMDSIRCQTLGEWELLLLDDGSTDDTRRIIEEYRRRDGRIQAYCFDDQKGPYVRRNFAIERARADFIVIHDADDLMCPTKLETLYREISKDDRLAMVGSNFRTFLEAYRGPQYSEYNQLPLTDDEILVRFKSWQHGMSHGSAIIRKALFAEIGLYDENPFAADSFWSAKLALYAEAGRPVVVKNVPECLTLIRLHATNHTRVLSTLDPRNRRARYRQYCEGKLWRIRERLKAQPGMDIGRELRQCTCGDFLTRFKAQILAWEDQPLDDRVIPESLRAAVSLFNRGYYVSCANVLNNVEAFEPAIAERVVGYDLLRGMAFFAVEMREQARPYLDREIRRHDNPAACQFVADAFESATPVDVLSWCQKHVGRFHIGLMEAEPRRSPQTTLSAARV